VAYKPFCLILMNKGVLKSHVSSISEGVHSYYRNRNIPWYRSNTKMARYDEFLLWKRPASGFHQSNLYYSTLENFSNSTKPTLIVYNKELSKSFCVLQAKHASYLTGDINCTGRVTLFPIPTKNRISTIIITHLELHINNTASYKVWVHHFNCSVTALF